MKQVVQHYISDKLAQHINCLKSEEEWVSSKSLIADAYNMIIEHMINDTGDQCKMEKWNCVLVLLSEYQNTIDLFHEEAKKE